MDLHFNTKSAFTRWIVKSGHLAEPFVVVDVGVQGGENPRWHLLGDYLVVYGFDAIKEVIDGLRAQNSGDPNRHYHCIAAGSADEEREFFVNAADSLSSSFYQQGVDRFGYHEHRVEQPLMVQVRRLDTLLEQGIISPPDFVKIDVEGFEKEVLLGAQNLLASVLGSESETNFNISPTYPKSHFGTLQAMLLERHLLLFDLNFNRIPRASFQQALVRKGLPPIDDQKSAGRPATVNVLFCRDPINEADNSNIYVGPCRPFTVDQLIKMMIIYELHGLNDIALDTAERFRNELSGRFDVDMAIDLLADPACLTSGNASIGGALISRVTSTLREVRRLLGRN